LAFTPRDAGTSSTQLIIGKVSIRFTSSEIERQLYFVNLSGRLRGSRKIESRKHQGSLRGFNLLSLLGG
jgi:hypothetical protein